MSRLAVAPRERPRPDNQVPRWRQLVELCVSCASAFFDEEALSRTHNVQIAYLIDFDEIHCFLSPWFKSRATEENIAAYPVVAAIFEAPAYPFLFSPGCIVELTSFLEHVKQASADLFDTVCAETESRARSALYSFFEQSQGESRLEIADADLLRAADTLAEIQGIATASLGRINTGIRKLRSLLSHPLALKIGSIVDPTEFRMSMDGFRMNTDVLASFPAAGRKQRSNRIDAHNICLADALNEHFRARKPECPDSPIYFFKVLTDTPTLYRAQGRLQLIIRYTDYFGQSMGLLEPAEHALLKRRFQALSEKDNDEIIEELLSSGSAALSSLQISQRHFLRGRDSLDAMILYLLPAGTGRTRRYGRRELEHFRNILRFAGAARRAISPEMRLLTEKSDRLPTDERPSYWPSAPEMCEEVLSSIDELNQVIEAWNTLGWTYSKLQNDPVSVLTELEDTVKMGSFGYESTTKADGGEFVVLLTSSQATRLGKQGCKLEFVRLSRVDGSIVVSWPRIWRADGELVVALNVLRRQYPESAEFPITASCMDDTIVTGNFCDSKQLRELIARSRWIRLLAPDFDYHVEISCDSEATPRSGIIMDSMSDHGFAFAHDVVLATKKLWISTTAFTNQFWDPAVKSLKSWKGKGGESGGP